MTQMTNQTTTQTTSYGDVTVTLSNDTDYGTITTTSSPSTYTTSATDSFTLSGDSYTINTDDLSPVTFGTGFDTEPSEITLGKSVLTEEKFQKLEALMDLIEGMGESDLLDMLNTQISLNKVKNGETTTD